MYKREEKEEISEKEKRKREKGKKNWQGKREGRDC